MKYVTYHIKGLGGVTPIAVKLTTNQYFVGLDIFYDAISLAGIQNVRINTSGRIRKDAVIIDVLQHYKYDFNELEKQYYDKCYNPKNF